MVILVIAIFIRDCTCLFWYGTLRREISCYRNPVRVREREIAWMFRWFICVLVETQIYEIAHYHGSLKQKTKPTASGIDITKWMRISYGYCMFDQHLLSSKWLFVAWHHKSPSHTRYMNQPHFGCYRQINYHKFLSIYSTKNHFVTISLFLHIKYVLFIWRITLGERLKTKQKRVYILKKLCLAFLCLLILD